MGACATRVLMAHCGHTHATACRACLPSASNMIACCPCCREEEERKRRLEEERRQREEQERRER